MAKKIPTLDPDIVIVKQSEGYVLYESKSTRKRWEVRGTCNQCGLCVIGAANENDYVWDKPAGQPYAVRDVRFPTRPDEPVTPAFPDAMRRMAKVTPTATVKGCSLEVSDYL